MKKRSIASRNYGLSAGVGDSLDPLGTHVPSSPSPTLKSSPIMPSSPVLDDVSRPGHDPLMAGSIALGVLLGLLILGVSGWAGYSYRRRLLRARDLEGDSSSKSFDASNVVEKGLKPRSSMDTYTLRPEEAQLGTVSESDAVVTPRVSFIDLSIPTADFIRPSDIDFSHTSQFQGKKSRISLAIEDGERILALVNSNGIFPSQLVSPLGLAAITEGYEQEGDADLPRPCSVLSSSTTSSTSSYTVSTPDRSLSSIDTRLSGSQSQTIINVKSIDTLRTAVGRTMSLQPSRKVLTALQLMRTGTDRNASTLEDIKETTVQRSKSFPARLLARRLSSSSSSSDLDSEDLALAKRGSQVLAAGYLRRALAALVQEPSAPLTMSDDEVKIQRYLSEVEAHERHHPTRDSLESSFTTENEFEYYKSSTGSWGTYPSSMEFDSYFQTSDDEVSEDDFGDGELDDFPLPMAHLPCIRVTSH
ncbi:hypothetical protein P7C73_g1725, partial [Tremellales sp. Uapishka_1]